MNGQQYCTTSNADLNPNFITGFSDAEATFHASPPGHVNYRAESKFYWRIRALFQIGTHIEELPLLLSIQNYFKGAGQITKDTEKK
jgi:hypothetical protein